VAAASPLKNAVRQQSLAFAPLNSVAMMKA
jgi:hypothetical protein